MFKTTGALIKLYYINKNDYYLDSIVTLKDIHTWNENKNYYYKSQTKAMCQFTIFDIIIAKLIFSLA